MGGGPVREQTRRMTLPTVVEITPRPEAVTPDTFIDGLGRHAARADGTSLSGARVARPSASSVTTKRYPEPE